MTPEPIRIEASTIGAWYDEFRRLRHGIFVSEQSWRGLSAEDEPGLTRPDPADRWARFWIARLRGGTLIGAVRVCAVRDAFPHEELFAHHLKVPEVALLRARMGSLNSLMVAAEWRRRPCHGPDGYVGTIANLLLRACVSESAAAGMNVIVATAQTVVSARALLRVGFRVIDAPARTPLHADFAMCNVGIVVSPTDQWACAVAAYFSECERRALGSRTIDERYSDAMGAQASADHVLVGR